MNSYCDIAASDGSGSMKAYLGMPAGKPKAGIVVIQEILGVNKDVRAMMPGRQAAMRPSPRTCSGG
jgi:carboxymethylenebutenolidase